MARGGRIADRIPLALEGWIEDLQDADDWGQPIMGTGGFFASFFYDFPPDLQKHFDDLIQQGRRELDPTRRAAAYSRIGLLSHEQARIIPGTAPRGRSFERSWLQGIVSNPALWDQDFQARYKANAPVEPHK